MGRTWHSLEYSLMALAGRGVGTGMKPVPGPVCDGVCPIPLLRKFDDEPRSPHPE